jgi:uncharacterized protein YdaU (DUF1376 family)
VLLPRPPLERLAFFRFFIADYLLDTLGLVTEEHGAYCLLMLNYYWAGSLPSEKEDLYRLCCAYDDRNRGAVDRILRRFFHDENGKICHHRIERELENCYSFLRSQSDKGKASAAKRAADAAKAGARPKKPNGEPEKGHGDEPTKGGNGDSGHTPGFLAFLQEFPVKIAKGPAWREWLNINPDAALEALIMDGLRRQIAAGKWQCDKRYRTHPDNWLKDKRWEDEIEPQSADSNVPYVHDYGKCAVCEKSLADGKVSCWKGMVCPECKNSGRADPPRLPIQA